MDAIFLMIIVFILGYAFITLEHKMHLDKAAVALMMAVILWIIQFRDATFCTVNMLCLGEHVSNTSQVILFLLAALTVVEIISSHQGFHVISELIHTRSKRKLLWVIGFVTFFLSSILDNLTTTIVMVSLLGKIIEDRKDRLLLGGGVVIAANAGGAWTPIGDVTTTMLWIGGQLSAPEIIRGLFLPSMACLITSFACLHLMLKGQFESPMKGEEKVEPFSKLIFYCGIGLLIFVPVFKMITNLPPFIGMLFALSVLWIITDIIHYRYEDRKHLRIASALSRVDVTSVLFFLGILLAVNALDASGILGRLAFVLDQVIGNTHVIAVAIGLASAVVDNVPLVAASMGMYTLAQFPMDADFWKLIAYCAGTGGSILIIGSAAGVVFMGMEKVNFFWYLRRVSLPALIGYAAGIAVYLIL